jgi:hypothetical protein
MYDSVRTIEAAEDSVRRAAAADSLRAAEEAADTLGVALADTAAVEEADTAAAEGQRGGEEEAADSLIGRLLVVDDSAAQAVEDSVAADTSHITMLLSERPQLSASWYLRLASGMTPGARYFITAIAENLSGAIAESQGLLILPEPVDTLLVPADTT